mgnify:CR=1 FL=1
MRACHAAEELLPAERGGCLRVLPPNGPGLLGWLEADPAQLKELHGIEIIHHYVNWTAQGEQLVHDPLNPPPMRTPEAFFFHTVRWGNVLRQHL